ncbi:hypothetical protein IEQ34_017057 [Dendrobium chrysotoxum]|uniref:Uncharacterized protein n=1 Tax=Dendrobium chrysotoxum TaxID=161865 RepID=A0AAV7GI94_DENCH|nr:hypothetical protein IEQ34_017057 [Dendrobium chrysotoxum]
MSQVPQPTWATELSSGWYSPYCSLTLSPQEALGEEGSEQRSRGKYPAPAAWPGAAPVCLIRQHHPEGHVGQWPPKWHPHWARLEAGHWVSAKKTSPARGENENMSKSDYGSPLEAKVIGGVLKDNLDERHWRAVLESNLLGHSSINSILRSSYKVLLNHLQNYFAFMLYVLTRSCF